MTEQDTKRAAAFQDREAAGAGVPGINKPEIDDPDRPPRPDKSPNPLDEAEGVAPLDADLDDEEFETDDEEEGSDEEEEAETETAE